MILLNGHSLEVRGILEPESEALNLSERDSSATVTTGMDAPAVSTGDWIRDDEEPGAGIVWRVKAVETQYDTETRSLQLEHMIRSLSDRILDNEVTPETIAGSGAVNCGAKQTVEYVLGFQDDWVLGDFDYTSVQNPYSFNGDTLLAAMETVTRSLSDPVWEYDFTSYPFTLHIRQRSESVGCEMREGRNITTLKATIDRSRMFTRFYPVGKSDLRLSSPGYVSQNEDLYGIVEKTETDQSMDTAEKLEAWARERLSRHCEPQVTITISGADLSESTGESLDRFRIGVQCRVPLPDFGTTINEKIVKLAWRDKIKDKESVTVTLANALEDVQSILKKEKAESGRSGRGGAKIQKDNELIIGDVESGLYTRISQTAYEIRLEAHNEAESMRSIISQTAESIRISVENDKESLRTLITQTASYIRQEAIDEANSLRSSITQTAESIRTEVANEAASIRSEVEQTASTWAARVSGVADSSGNVTAASIALAINNSTGQSEAKIDADKVYIGNSKSTTVINGKASLSDVTADYIAGKIAQLSSLTVVGLRAATITTTYGVYASGFYTGSGSYTNIKDQFIEDLSISQSGNTYTLKKKINGQETDVGSFSRATSLSGEWSGTVAAGKSYKVTASPQGTTHYSPSLDSITFRANSKSWASDKKSFTQKLYAYDEDGTDVIEETLSFSTTESYNEGYSKGSPSSGTAGGRTSGVSALVHDFTITRSDGTTKTLNIDCTSIYNTARTGYSIGTYALASVTLQGSSQTCYFPVDDGGTMYYQKASDVTYYLRNTSSTITIKKYNNGVATMLYKSPSANADIAGGGAKKWWYEDSTGTNYYTSGGSATVTPIDTNNSLRLSSGLRYKAGSTVADTYYTKTS